MLAERSKVRRSGMLVARFPLEDVCVCPQTPATRVPSHGLAALGLEYAIDFVVVDPGFLGKPYRRSVLRYAVQGLPLEDFYGWGRPLFSPVGGEVAAVEDGIAERNPVHPVRDGLQALRLAQAYRNHRLVPSQLTGNCVTIRTPEGVYAVLAHLKEGSVRVRPGQHVVPGTPLGELGHSGNSTMPHLHLQFMTSLKWETTRGLPFVFGAYERWNGETWVPVAQGVPAKGELVRSLRG
jgi:murein DD-endopeptidase MepM/ murein hydrolase activator NlpD